MINTNDNQIKRVSMLDPEVSVNTKQVTSKGSWIKDDTSSTSHL